MLAPSVTLAEWNAGFDPASFKARLRDMGRGVNRVLGKAAGIIRQAPRFLETHLEATFSLSLCGALLFGSAIGNRPDIAIAITAVGMGVMLSVWEKCR